MHSSPIKAAIIGASGYTGIELVRLLYHHPHVKITALAADSNADQPLENIYPHTRGYKLPMLVKQHAIDYSNVDVIFCCLPHATSQEVIKTLQKDKKIIDLSADFRLRDPQVYEKWYGHAHQALELQKEAVYGLTEINRNAIKSASLVACPGCYPTSSLLPLIPLLKEKAIAVEPIIIDAKSGISGAGRSAKTPNLFCEVNEGVRPYGVSNHRHMPEIEQALTEAAGKEVMVQFTPQVVPLSRGMLSSIYVNTAKGYNVNDIHTLLENFYKHEPFVDVAPLGHAPSTREVMGTNQCRITVFPGRFEHSIVLVSVIDNLTKGASGQAVQNMNVMFGLPETSGLEAIAIYP